MRHLHLPIPIFKLTRKRLGNDAHDASHPRLARVRVHTHWYTPPMPPMPPMPPLQPMPPIQPQRPTPPMTPMQHMPPIPPTLLTLPPWP